MSRDRRRRVTCVQGSGQPRAASPAGRRHRPDLRTFGSRGWGSGYGALQGRGARHHGRRPMGKPRDGRTLHGKAGCPAERRQTDRGREGAVLTVRRRCPRQRIPCSDDGWGVWRLEPLGGTPAHPLRSRRDGCGLARFSSSGQPNGLPTTALPKQSCLPVSVIPQAEVTHSGKFKFS
jgi:hypothetical protein